MDVMSMDYYERLQFDSKVYFKLKEAELEAKTTGQRFSHEEVFSDLKRQLQEQAAKDV